MRESSRLVKKEVCGNGWSKRAWQDEANEKQTLQCMIGPKNSRRNGREREREEME
ncbi:Uncharacterized protein HZ326_31853, partial [Fusarium oxysporum f. sp. albedinis]